MSCLPDDTFPLLSVRIEIGVDAGADGLTGEDDHFQQAFLEHWSDRVSMLLEQRGGECLGHRLDLKQYTFPYVDACLTAAAALLSDSTPAVLGANLVTPSFRVAVHRSGTGDRAGYSCDDALASAERATAEIAARKILIDHELRDQLSAVLRDHTVATPTAEGVESDGLYELDWRQLMPRPPEDDDSMGSSATQQVLFAQSKARAAPRERVRVEGGAPDVWRRKSKLVLPRTKKSGPEDASEPDGLDDDLWGELGPRLQLTSGTDVALVDEVAPAIAIGRSSKSDLVVKISVVSRRHADIIFRGDCFLLVDHSSNGTYVYDEDGRQSVVRDQEVELPRSGWISFGRAAGRDDEKVVLFRADSSEF